MPVLFASGAFLVAGKELPNEGTIWGLAGIPKGYEISETQENKSISPNGRFAVLFPLPDDTGNLNDWKNTAEYPPNLLVCLKPYRVVATVTEKGMPIGSRQHRPWFSCQLRTEWCGNTVVAISERCKWGISALSIYEIENDRLKRVHPVLQEAKKYFDRDFHARFLKKYPEEIDQYKFVSASEEGSDERDFWFKGRDVIVNIYAANKPNVAPGPNWTAELHGVWNLDSGKFKHVDFRPQEITMNK